MSDIHYAESEDIQNIQLYEYWSSEGPYTFISVLDDYDYAITNGRRAGLTLLDAKWKNLVNVQISTSNAQIIIQNTSFENIEMENRAFLNLWWGDLEMSNISLK